MMHLQSETEKMLAAALHEAGQTDREIADACQTSVNNVIWWRRDQGLKENGGAPAQQGDFISFGEAFGHTVLEASKLSTARLATIAAKVRNLRGSVVLSLDGLEIEQQMEAVSAFLGALFDAPAEDWHPALVAVDEAHLFAPAGDNGEDRETRKLSQQTMANLMCRGRKRGLAGIVATQRLSKLHKNVAAEASNFLIGRTFLDIDIQRAADLLGMSRADSEQVRNLARGDFLGLGPAISRRPVRVTVGPAITQGKAGVEKGITPLPSLRPEDMHSLLLADDGEDDPAEPDAVVVPFAARGR